MTKIRFRKYNSKKDIKAVLRIWEEVGWLEENRDKKQNKALSSFFNSADAYITEISGEAECLVNMHPAKMKYLDEDIDLCAVTGVAVSRIARKQNIATRLLARALSEAAAKGYVAAGLGIFDQGFYNRLGFGNSPYTNWIHFSPSNLNVKSSKQIPSRLEYKDYKKIHKSRINRLRKHGSVNIIPVEFTQIEMACSKNCFGLGFYNNMKELTHHIMLDGAGEHGPYRVAWMSYQNYKQMLELLSILKSLNDQIYLIKMCEPPDIQFQDLMLKPFRLQDMTGKSKYENHIKAYSYHQYRILNIQESIKRIKLPGSELDFNLHIDDPINDFLDADSSWKGLAGEYAVHLGKKSEIKNGYDKKLPQIKASVGAFTRLWLGCAKASSLSATDAFSAPEELLQKLDCSLHVPVPDSNWDY